MGESLLEKLGWGDFVLLYFFDSLLDFVNNFVKLFFFILFKVLEIFVLFMVFNSIFMLNLVKDIRFFIGGGLGMVGCSFGFGRVLGIGVIS